MVGADEQGLDGGRAGHAGDVVTVGDDEAVPWGGRELGDDADDVERHGGVRAVRGLEPQPDEVAGVELVVVECLL